MEHWIDGVRTRQRDDKPVSLGLEYHYSLERALAEIAELWRSEVDPVRRRLLIGAAYEAAAVATPVARWLLALGRTEEVARTVTTRAGDQDAAEVRDAAALFARWDSQYGGGSMRQAAASYLESRVVPLLQGRHSDAVARDLFSAAAELARVVGWSTYDTGLHGLAQRHLLQALRLA